MTATHIRPAAKQDIPHIRHIVDITWPVTYGDILSADQLAYMIDMFYSEDSLTEQMDSGHQFFILWEDSIPTGFIDIEKTGGTYCKLHKIYLLPTCQGKGYGKDLMLFAFKQGQGLGAQLLKLNVNRHNKALGFYERMGFIIEETVDNPIGRGYYMNDYVMVKSLSD